jgi:hypothetical protein
MGAHEFGGCSPRNFLRADVNGDGLQDMSDAVSILEQLFLGGFSTTCRKAADTNDDGKRDPSDAVFLLQFLYLEGEAPPSPFLRCDVDPTLDELSCLVYPPCG